jgi:hypothetical protein
VHCWDRHGATELLFCPTSAALYFTYDGTLIGFNNDSPWSHFNGYKSPEDELRQTEVTHHFNLLP